VELSPDTWDYLSGERVDTIPNAISLGGYACTIGWLAGGSPWLAALGLLADEIDGDSARELGQTSAFGRELDWAIDVGLAAVIAIKLGGLWIFALPAITAGQALLRSQGKAPALGSARALMTVIALG
jgi:phosphatidylglycerophosphate synthase